MALRTWCYWLFILRNASIWIQTGGYNVVRAYRNGSDISHLDIKVYACEEIISHEAWNMIFLTHLYVKSELWIWWYMYFLLNIGGNTNVNMCMLCSLCNIRGNVTYKKWAEGRMHVRGPSENGFFVIQTFTLHQVLVSWDTIRRIHALC